MAVDHHYTEQQTYSGLLHDPAKLDPLTGFHHQSYLDEVLNKKIKGHRLNPAATSLAILQLENFYEIRTWLGKSDASLSIPNLIFDGDNTFLRFETLSVTAEFVSSGNK